METDRAASVDEIASLEAPQLDLRTMREDIANINRVIVVYPSLDGNTADIEFAGGHVPKLPSERIHHAPLARQG